MDSISLSQVNLDHPNDGPLNQYTSDTIFEFESNEFYFLEFFLGIGYYLLISPFRLGRTKNGNYKIHTHILQKAASTVVIILVAVHEILDLRVYLSKNLMESPEKAFMYSYQILLKMYPIIWFSTFWIRRDRFDKLLSQCQKSGIAPRKPKFLWLSTLSAIIILTEAKFFWEHAASFHDYGFYGVFQQNGGIGLYNLRIKDSDNPIPDEEMTLSTTIFCIGYMLISSVSVNIEYFLEIFALISAIMVYHSSVHFIKALRNLTPFDVKKIVEIYTNFISILNSINSIAGYIIIIYVVGMVPTFIWCVFGLLDPSGEGVDYAIFYIHKVLMSLSVLILGAKANDKAEELNDWILKTKTEQLQSSFSNGITSQQSLLDQTDDDQKGFNNFLDFVHRQGCNNPMGLKGGSYFTISYSFMGAAASVVVTYAVVMLQFQVERYKTLKALGALQENLVNLINSTQDWNGTVSETDMLQNLFNISGDNIV